MVALSLFRVREGGGGPLFINQGQTLCLPGRVSTLPPETPGSQPGIASLTVPVGPPVAAGKSPAGSTWKFPKS